MTRGGRDIDDWIRKNDSDDKFEEVITEMADKTTRPLTRKQCKKFRELAFGKKDFWRISLKKDVPDKMAFLK
jgi:hypothetical protein